MVETQRDALSEWYKNVVEIKESKKINFSNT